MNDKSKTSQWWSRGLGWGLAALALVVYFATLSPTFYPGLSASLSAQHVGLLPFSSMSNILWGWLVQALAGWPVGTLAFRLNALSAVCAAGVVYLLYRVMLDIRPMARHDPNIVDPPVLPVQHVAGVVAALYLMASIPFWILATRAHPLTFDLLLALIPFRLVQHAEARGRTGPLFLAALAYGLGVTEYSTMIVLGPVLGLLILAVLLRQGNLRLGLMLGLIGCLLAGLIPYLISAWQYMQQPAYVWRAFESYDQVLKYIWLEQWQTLTRSLPKVGWLTIGVLTLLPWLVSMGYRVAARTQSSGQRVGRAVVHILLTIVLAAVLWDVPLSPWRTTRGTPMVVIPYLFAAMGMGFVAAFALDFVYRSRDRRNAARLPAIGWVLGALFMLFPVVAAVRHLPETDGRSGVVASRYVDAVLDSVGDRAWLLTSGEADAELVLHARQRGQRVTFINPRASQVDAYQNYLASLFADDRLKGLAKVGLAPLLQEWFARTGVVEQVAVMSSPELWEAMGFEAVPEGLLYTGEAPDTLRDPVALVEQFNKMVQELGPALQQAVASDTASPAVRWNVVYLNDLSRQANNLGVYAEDQKRSDLAGALYRQALGYSSNNLSALINLNTLARTEKQPDADELAARLEALVKAREGDYTLWSLSRMHGYVRTPEVFASRGWTWAMSGQPGMAVREIKRAIRSGGDTPAAQLALAQMYFAQDEVEQSEVSYRKLLAVNPDHAPALLGLARLAARRGDYAEARSGLVRLRQLDVNVDALDLEEALIEAMSGDLPSGADRLRDLVKRSPEDARAWTALALVANQQGDAKQAEAALAKLATLRNLAPSLRLALAQMALARRDMAGARRQLDEVLRAQPSHVQALELVLRISQTAGDRAQVEKSLNRLLTADPAHAYGNFLLGTFQYIREEYALAEASFRASLAARRSAETLNAIAYLLVLKGNLDEAEPLVREALKEDDGLANAWDTLANILIKRNRLAEAEEAMQKAVALSPKEASIQASLVRLYAAQGRQPEAIALAEELQARPSELSSTDLQNLREILKSYRNRE